MLLSKQTNKKTDDRAAGSVISRKAIGHGGALFIMGLIAAEIIQYFLIIDRGYLGGDFGMSVSVDSDTALLFSLIVSISIWVLTYLIFLWARSDGPVRISIPTTPVVLSIFIFNVVITLWGNVGHVESATKSPLSILTTLIPVNYLILLIAQQRKLNKKFYVASIILIVIDLYRLLLGAIFKIVYITLMRASRKHLLIMLLMLPLMLTGVQALVSYKFQSRGIEIDNVEEVVVDVVTSRVATVSTVHFMTLNDAGLAKYCHGVDYPSPWVAAALSVIPKSMFGLTYVKTYNNCLIEFLLSRPVSDSSVNSPWLMTLYVEAFGGPLQFLSYFVLTAGLFFSIIKLSNYLFGASGDIFKLWVIFEFMWTGNILHLTIPFYFLCLLVTYLWVRRSFFGTTPILMNEKNNAATT